ncbi:hypothetical protein MG290_05585 [Flavobacterium sp. CBA20B-1]|uniref:hypothetical protein n=1 Tax=unclassified Flavobacterium TaxID=196869 RepID=UPI0022246243|nr:MULTISPECIES: hypothetical protein [unclassified Flavobacterium]WCM43141.1 hypothetical protein MG290_05585 [Flavobacterium sp. CBA20B-1]
MKKALILFVFLFFGSISSAQTIDLETEKAIIKQTLSQYLDTNPNSIASYIKGRKGYEMIQFGLVVGTVMEEVSIQNQEIKNALDSLEFVSKAIENELKERKINVYVNDTLFAYQYKPALKNLKNKDDWQTEYSYLLEDFEENKHVRLDTIIGKEYIDLIKKQIDFKGTNQPILLNQLNHSYYEFSSSDKICQDEYCVKLDKIFRLVLNSNATKACYLVSFYCRKEEICRSFIFIRKEKDQWIYVDEYPSWLIDEA